MGVELGALGFDHDMTDVAGVAVVAVEQSAIEDDAAADAGRHDHADEVRHAAGPALPCLTERKRLRVIVDVHGQAGVLSESGAKRKVSPDGDVDRRHRLAGLPHGASAAHTADTHGRHRGMCCDLVEKFRQSNEQGLGVGDIRRRCPSSINDRPVYTDDADLDLRATDIDR